MSSKRTSWFGGLALLALVVVAGCQTELKGGFNPPPTPPAISPNPDSLGFLASQGGSDPAPATLAIANLGGGTLDSLTVSSITYAAGQPTGWLAAAASGSPPTVSVQPSVGGLTAGTYSAALVLSHPTATNSPVQVPVSFTVSALPVLGLSSRLLRFSATPLQGSLPPQTVNLTNLGPGTLSGLSVGTIQYAAGEPIGWVSAVLSGSTAPATLSITANAGSLAPGSYTASVPVHAPGASNTTEVVAVNITVSAAPVIQLSATTVNFSGTAGGANPAAASVTLTNGGGGSLTGLSLGTTNYGAGAAGWLSASLVATSAPTAINLTANIASLPAGTYIASVPVQAADTTIPVVSLTVRLTLTSPPTITFSAGTVNFTGITGGAAPTPQSVLISNGGTGTLSGLSVGSVSYGAGATGWLTASLNGTTAPATLTLTVAPGALGQGLFSATVPVNSSLAGVVSKSVTVTIAIANNAPAALVGLSGNNQAGTIGSPLPLTIRARVLNGASQPFAGAPVTWNAGQGGSISNQTVTTDQNGEVIATWTLGPNQGAQTLTVQSPGVPSFTFNATAVGLPVSGRPNEPPGLSVLTDRPFNAKVESGWTDRGDPGFHIVSDPSAPQSLPTIGEATFPLGFAGGRGPIQTDFHTTTQPKRIYVALWLKLSPNWDGHSSYVNKVFHIWINGVNRVYLTLTGIDSMPFTPRIALQGVNETPVSRNLGPNAGAQAKVYRGRWHLWEVELIANTPGQPDGEARWWLDGVKVGDYAGINYLATGAAKDYWEIVSWNPTWGGAGDIVPATQYMWIDNVYVSGQ